MDLACWGEMWWASCWCTHHWTSHLTPFLLNGRSGPEREEPLEEEDYIRLLVLEVALLWFLWGICAVLVVEALPVWDIGGRRHLRPILRALTQRNPLRQIACGDGGEG
jgi:hypothetical protein